MPWSLRINETHWRSHCFCDAFVPVFSKSDLSTRHLTMMLMNAFFGTFLPTLAWSCWPGVSVDRAPFHPMPLLPLPASLRGAYQSERLQIINSGCTCEWKMVAHLLSHALCVYLQPVSILTRWIWPPITMVSLEFIDLLDIHCLIFCFGNQSFGELWSPKASQTCLVGFDWKCFTSVGKWLVIGCLTGFKNSTVLIFTIEYSKVCY